MTYDPDGRIVRRELYYAQVSMLVQLGHMPHRKADQPVTPPAQPGWHTALRAY